MKQELRTARLRLRPPRPGDEHAAFAWTSDVQVLKYMPWLPHADVAQTKAQLGWDSARWLKRSAWTWLLVEDERAIGFVQLVPQRLDGPAHHLRVGYLLARAHWGRGLMREALAAVLDQAFAQPPVWRVDAVCDVDNAASAHVLLACGFALEGVLGRCELHPNIADAPRDVALYAKLRG